MHACIHADPHCLTDRFAHVHGSSMHHPMYLHTSMHKFSHMPLRISVCVPFDAHVHPHVRVGVYYTYVRTYACSNYHTVTARELQQWHC